MIKDELELQVIQVLFIGIHFQHCIDARALPGLHNLASILSSSLGVSGTSLRVSKVQSSGKGIEE